MKTISLHHSSEGIHLTTSIYASTLIHNLELIVFPLLNEKMDMSTELSQHEVIRAGIDKIAALIDGYKTNSVFDVDELKAIVVNLREPLVRPPSFILYQSLILLDALPVPAPRRRSRLYRP